MLKQLNFDTPDIVLAFCDKGKIVKTIRASSSETGYILIKVSELSANMNYFLPEEVKKNAKTKKA